MRGRLDCVAGKVPASTKVLPTAYVTHSPRFESAVVNIQHGNSDALSHEEQKSGKIVKETQTQHRQRTDLKVDLSFAERTFKGVPCISANGVHDYCSLHFLLHISDIGER